MAFILPILRRGEMKVQFFAGVFLGLFLSGCGGSGSDPGSDHDPSLVQNQPPIADAGPDVEAFEKTSVQINGNNSTDDKEIVSYQWEQVQNGSYWVILNDPNENSANISIPPLDNDQVFVFRLKVKDEEGEVSTDEITIKGRPTPDIIVSEVTGNTATLRSQAQFTIKLSGPPDNPVDIPLLSTVINEGGINTNLITFTQENWNQEQTVIVTGVNPFVQDFSQNYAIQIGPSISTDAAYNDIEVPDVPMLGLSLILQQPQHNQLIANLEGKIKPTTYYTGGDPLVYTLLNGPVGMTIDIDTGSIQWTPEDADEGNSFTVGVSVTDGNRTDDIDLQIYVTQPTLLNTVVSGQTMTVVDPNSNLNGLSITSSGDLNDLVLERIDSTSVPQLPKSIIRFSDVFVVKEPFDSEVEFKIPLNDIINNFGLVDLKLFSYVEAFDVEGKFWSRILLDQNLAFEGDKLYLKISTGGLQGIYFFGTSFVRYSTNNTAEKNKSSMHQTLSSRPEDIGCQPAIRDDYETYEKYFPDISRNEWEKFSYIDQTCTDIRDDSFSIRVLEFGLGDNSERWGGAKIEDLVNWLTDSHTKFDELDLNYDKNILVVLDDLGEHFGYVTNGNNEKRKTLHLDENDGNSIREMKATAVHEYFHNAQGHSENKIYGPQLMIDSGKATRWFIEGSATWFEDFVYDEINSYEATLNYPAYRILEEGLNSPPGENEKNSYHRFSFIKLLDQKCRNFRANFKEILNIYPDDSTGIESLIKVINESNCSFGNFFDDNNQGLEAAMAYYNFATIINNSIDLIDNTELQFLNPFDFEGLNPAHDIGANNYLFRSFKRWVEAPDGQKNDSTPNLDFFQTKEYFIKPAGAITLIIPGAIGTYPPFAKPKLVFDSTSNLFVSILDKDSRLNGLTLVDGLPSIQTHVDFETSITNEYYYDTNYTVPELYITIVNPDVNESAVVNVSFDLESEFWVGTYSNIATAGISGAGVEHLNHDVCKRALVSNGEVGSYGERNEGEIRFREGFENGNVRLDFIDGWSTEWNACKKASLNNNQLTDNQFSFNLPYSSGYGWTYPDQDSVTVVTTWLSPVFLNVDPDTRASNFMSGTIEAEVKYKRPEGWPYEEVDVTASCSGLWEVESTFKPFPKCLLNTGAWDLYSSNYQLIPVTSSEDPPRGTDISNTDSYEDIFIDTYKSHRPGEWSGFDW